jgi:MoxR-like ATPase
MAEKRVTSDGKTYDLKSPFLVIATQNPIDQEGTFPLPEAQLDRFLVRLSLGYPTMEEESRMLLKLQKGHPIDELSPVVKTEDWLACQEAVRDIHVDDKIRKYVLEIVHGTRSHEEVQLGGSPRASIALFRTGQAMAALQGRDFVTPDDIKKMAGPVLCHRMILRPEARLRRKSAQVILNEIIEEIAVPLTDRQKATSKDYFDE